MADTIGLPGDLLHEYTLYKQATKAFLAWLQERIRTHPQALVSQTVLRTTTNIVHAAQQLKARKDEVPSYVLSLLRDSIKRRRQVHTFYRSRTACDNDSAVAVENENHKAFIDRSVVVVVRAIRSDG